jgi:luciferase family oxidoreductase group 1
MTYFGEPEPGQAVRAVPGAGLRVPIWILGSSLFGSQLAAALGLPYAFASHFAPAHLADAIALYRREFRPSADLDRPYVMIGVNVIAADTDAEAERLATSQQQAFLSLRRGDPVQLPPPRERFLESVEPFERALIEQTLSVAAVGSRATVTRKLQEIIDRTAADELIIASQVFDHAARLRSYDITASVRQQLAQPA